MEWGDILGEYHVDNVIKYVMAGSVEFFYDRVKTLCTGLLLELDGLSACLAQQPFSNVTVEWDNVTQRS